MVHTILIVAQARDPREHGDGQNVGGLKKASG